MRHGGFSNYSTVYVVTNLSVTFQASPSALSSASSRTPSSSVGRLRMCRAGADENRSLGPRWRNSTSRCCGRVSYFPSDQTCCDTHLFDMPTEDAR